MTEMLEIFASDSMIISAIFDAVGMYFGAFLIVVATWAGVMFGIAKTGSAIAMMLVPLAAFTPSKKDDRWLVIAIYWLDAAEDVFEQLALLKRRKVAKVFKRIYEDMGKPYKERRTE